MRAVSIGFRTKTARAIAIALTGDPATPEYIGRWNVSLMDPQLPATGQPHHEVMELPWGDALSAVRPIEKRIEEVAIDMLADLLTELESKGARVISVGVVGSPERNIERIGNRHMRAHAAEGILFRRVIEAAAAKHSLKCGTFSDRGFEEFAISELGQNSTRIKGALTRIGRTAGKPWRIDERAAAIAAWLTLLLR